MRGRYVIDISISNCHRCIWLKYKNQAGLTKPKKKKKCGSGFSFVDPKVLFS